MTTPIDLRSDTVTRPSPEMRAAMAAAPVGDDQYGEDPTTNRLQEHVAALLGKEAALWLPSGTMANQVALRVLTRPGDDVIVSRESHAVWHETGGSAANAGVQLTEIGARGVFSAAEFVAAVKPRDHGIYPPTTLVEIENTHNRAGGVVFAQDEVERICAAARERGIATLSRRRTDLECRGRDRPRRRPARRALRSGRGVVLQGTGRAGRVAACRLARAHRPGAAPSPHARRRDAPGRHLRRRRPARARAPPGGPGARTTRTPACSPNASRRARASCSTSARCRPTSSSSPWRRKRRTPPPWWLRRASRRLGQRARSAHDPRPHPPRRQPRAVRRSSPDLGAVRRGPAGPLLGLNRAARRGLRPRARPSCARAPSGGACGGGSTSA